MVEMHLAIRVEAMYFFTKVNHSVAIYNEINYYVAFNGDLLKCTL